MALTEIPIPIRNFRIDTTNPAVIADVDDTNGSKSVIQYADAASKDAHALAVVLPDYLSGTGDVTIRWRINDTSTGTCRWSLLYFAIADNNDMSPGTTTVTVETAADGTAMNLNTTTFTGLTITAASKVMRLLLRREGGHVNDTLTGLTVEVVDVVFSYTCDATFAKGYQFIPAQAFAIPGSSGATRGGVVLDAIVPQSFVLRESQDDAVQTRFTIPSNFGGNLTVTVLQTNAAGSNAIMWRIDAGLVAAGGSTDPSLTAGTAFSVTQNVSANTLQIDQSHALPVTAASGREVVLQIVRVGTDGGDSNTGNANLFGVWIQYDVVGRNPGIITLDPTCGSIFSTSTASDIQRSDTNSDKFVRRFPDSVISTGDYARFIPSVYASGGILRIAWDSPAASGNGVWKIQWASPASGASSDPAWNAGTEVVAATSGANKRNQFIVGISGLAASDTMLVRISRLADDSGGSPDTLGDVADLLEVIFEANVTP